MTTDSSAAALRTALHSRHTAAGARMVDFAGWDMPIQYRSILAEHQAVRSGVGVFDLSHMGRLYVRGEGAHALVQWLATNDVARLAPGRAQYSLFCAVDGRILDDIVVYNLGDEMLVVVNASNREKLLAWIEDLRASSLAPAGAELRDATSGTAMIGFQGPESERLLQELVEAPLADLRYYAAARTKVAGRDALVARTGYTAEDGFEVILASGEAPAVWDMLLEERSGVTPSACGLGARDTLRLEAGMALYGHEIDETINPYEAGLGRVVKLDKGEFVSRAALAEIAERGVTRGLAAFELVQSGVPRQGYAILDNGQPVGCVTSGTMSPSLGKPIGMGYLPTELVQPDREVAVEIRGRPIPAKIVPLPFYPHRTKRTGRPAPGRA
jgi:aminomethyltransferase